jgi:hypothetical protein
MRNFIAAGSVQQRRQREGDGLGFSTDSYGQSGDSWTRSQDHVNRSIHTVHTSTL